MNERTKNILWVVFAIVFASQFSVIRQFHPHLGPGWAALYPGLAVFGAAFILSWAAELSQFEIPRSLAIAFLALIAVLPEYAVDVYLAWMAGQNPEYIAKAAANMTGSNRLLIGIGWPVVLVAYWWATRKKAIDLPKESKLELRTLLIATLFSFSFVLMRSFTIWHSILLFIIFVYYMYLAARTRHTEPEIEGPVELFSSTSRPCRVAITILFFILSGYAIYSAAEPFAEGLIITGKQWGVNDFLLIQWLAPLASESPEFIVAVLFALRANATGGLGTLISSKINQWTLLISTLPIAFCISAGVVKPMPLDNMQVQEVFLTVAQSLFALIIIVNLRFNWFEALVLAVLFLGQLAWQIKHMVFDLAGGTIPEAGFDQVRMGFAYSYLGLAVLVLIFSKSHRRGLFELFKK